MEKGWRRFARPGCARTIAALSPVGAALCWPPKLEDGVMLRVNGLRTKAGGPADLDLAAGEIVALRGPSGAGKSLILRAIADLDPVEGEISLDGTARDRIPAPEWRRRAALVPAESGWWADGVREHFGSDVDTGLLEALGLDPAALDWEVRRLSTGERHRLAIARALALKPQVWLLDEPTAALDAEATARVERLLEAERSRGAAILLVTHDPAQAARLADRTFGVAHGRLTETAG
jgi:ABC-type multidrug transport system ATPase subunit